MRIPIPSSVDLATLAPLVDRFGGTLEVTAEGVVVELEVPEAELLARYLPIKRPRMVRPTSVGPMGYAGLINTSALEGTG